MEQMNFIPNSLRMAAEKMGFNRSRFRLETQGSTVAAPGQSISIQLPENALIDLKSFRLMCDVTTSMDTTTQYAKLPDEFSSLISTFQVFCGGVCISQATSDYGLICKVLKLVKSSRERDSSIDTLLTHGTMSGVDANDDVSVCFTPKTGLFDSDSRYLPSMLTGSVTIVIQFQSPAVLGFKTKAEGDLSAGYDASNALARGRAQAATFSVSNIFATCDTINMNNGFYEATMLERISRGEDLQMVYKEYHTFRRSNISSTSAEHTFSLSSSSIDVLYSVFQQGNYTTNGVPTRKYEGAGFSGDTFTTNALYFDSCCNDGSGAKASRKKGSTTYQYFINNVPQTAYPASPMDAAADTVLVADKISLKSSGHLIQSLKDWNYGKGVFPCVLHMTENPQFIRSGYDARGSNSSCSVNFNNLLMPSTAATKAQVDHVSLVTIAEVSQVLHIKGGRQLLVEY